MALVGKKLCSTSLDPVFHVPVNLQHLPMRRTKCVHEKQFLNLMNSRTLGFINVSSHLDCDVSPGYIYIEIDMCLHAAWVAGKIL
jgi:hypothetical protein